MTKIIMLMGFQRSGTSTLYRAMERDRRIRCFNESKDNPVFDDFFLKPESEIRPVLTKDDSPVLVKSISETKRRSVADVLREYDAYDVWLVHIYRDPVNVFLSRRTKWPQLDDPKEFVSLWNRRNESMLSVLADNPAKTVNVKYEDIVHDPRVFMRLCSFLDVKGRYIFKTDSNRGRRRLPSEIVSEIEEGTGRIVNELNACRSYAAEGGKVRIGLTRSYLKSRALLDSALRRGARAAPWF